MHLLDIMWASVGFWMLQLHLNDTIMTLPRSFLLELFHRAVVFTRLLINFMLNAVDKIVCVSIVTFTNGFSEHAIKKNEILLF